ncbi:MAG TPA: NAD(P)/FAD-dependent oxidoreductase [Flavilitoribacter sp.]|nr:NAD(P)/FAD-dependent oxidoreductase [Flavilitoribacter sp.]HMQ90875.1 NAD(P)/FAD-dependent oxidoreductase [Flavilitoribacter sp.]
MANIPTYDAVIIGGGPAGSTCAHALVKAGLNTLVVDSARFPRVKLCAGWISPPIWAVLDLLPEAYTGGLWPWRRIHVHFHGKKYKIRSKGYFIRRYEFDEFLLKRSRARVVEDHHVRQIEKDAEGYWLIDGEFRARYLIGAGGSHCPVARALFPKPENDQCGTQEKEFEGNPDEIAACRAGADGEPQVLLHDNLGGYSWNIPKGSWLNIGSGTKIARAVVPAWSEARAFFEGNDGTGNIPVASRPELDKMKGHGYRVFDPKCLEHCRLDGAFLIGDALGVAQPLTGEGILPAVLSGKLCADAIIGGAPESYARRMTGHPLFREYRLLHNLLAWEQQRSGGKPKNARPSRLRDWLVVQGFAWLFGAKRVPAGWLLVKLLRLNPNPFYQD